MDGGWAAAVRRSALLHTYDGRVSHTQSIPFELARYHRQMLLPQVGVEGQEKLGAAHALIVGCGALGTVIADALCRAGVGTLTIVDRDTVELTNLQRQILFDEEDARQGLPKAEAARRKLERVNSAVRVRAVIEDFNATNAERLAGIGTDRPAQVLLDATDNFETRYLLNDLAVKHGIPMVYGGAVSTTGMTFTIVPRRAQGAARAAADEAAAGPCLRCLFESAPPPGTTPTCDTAGVLGPAVSVIASIQAAEAIKVLLGRADLLRRSLLTIDLFHNELRELDVSGALRPECPCCGARRFEYLEGGGATEVASLCGRGAIQINPAAAQASAGTPRLDLAALAERLRAHGEFELTRFLLKGSLSGERGDAGEEVELTVFADGRAIIKGVHRPESAKSIYARYIGA